MCGIFGMLALGERPLQHPERLDEMAAVLRHRGPDGSGAVRGPRLSMGLDRLRIVDLHERADQPFRDPETGTTLICNGEIYNAAALRDRYPDYPYRSRSDVETILPLYRALGSSGLSELDGMFGLAIWDEQRGCLTLARDRAGEKPLFVCRTGGELWFASELQALLVHPELSHELDDEALNELLTLGYVREPRTALRHIRRVAAGTIVEIVGDRERVSRYWDPFGFAAPDAPEDVEALLDALLVGAIAKQSVSEVPTGIFVSGGLDSSLLATLSAHAVGVDSTRTFAARFSAASYDEADHAARLAQRLGCRHVEVLIDDATMRQAFDAVTASLAEPLADPAILPTYLLARRAADDGVKVILSGEGADELFGGYPTYVGHRLAPLLSSLPTALRRMLRGAVDRLPASHGKVTLEFLAKRFLAAAEQPWVERHQSWFGTGAVSTLLPARRTSLPAPQLPQRIVEGDVVAGAMLLDYTTYLRDNLLVKVDRATMMSSVEARAPFLDREVSAFALSLPSDLAVRRTTTKWLLKRVARRWLPRDITDRTKRGLSVPVAGWINGGLREETDRLLEPARLARQELLDPEAVATLLAAHREGRANHARPLWALIVLQAWLERWLPERAA